MTVHEVLEKLKELNAPIKRGTLSGYVSLGLVTGPEVKTKEGFFGRIGIWPKESVAEAAATYHTLNMDPMSLSVYSYDQVLLYEKLTIDGMHIDFNQIEPAGTIKLYPSREKVKTVREVLHQLITSQMSLPWARKKLMMQPDTMHWFRVWVNIRHSILLRGTIDNEFESRLVRNVYGDRGDSE